MDYDEPQMNGKEKKELALAKVILAVLALIALLIIGWISWIKPKSDAKSMVNSYAECVAAGNPIQTSYPETCTTPQGRSFTNTK